MMNEGKGLLLKLKGGIPFADFEMRVMLNVILHYKYLVSFVLQILFICICYTLSPSLSPSVLLSLSLSLSFSRREQCVLIDCKISKR